MKKVLLVVIILIVGYQFIPNGDREEVYVERIIDGDTFVSNGVKFRLADIDAPEINQYYGDISKRYLADLIENKTVEIEIRATDKYSRKIVEVYIDNESVSEIMVANGMAWWYEKFSDDNNLKRLEQRARNNKIGLWKEYNPINPYLFRKSKK